MIKGNLFDLTEEQVELSRSLYNGKVIKCVVAPYHSYDDLKHIVDTDRVFLFPEKNSEMSYFKIRSFINMIVNETRISVDEDVLIITSDMNIVLDIVDSCIRILTGDDELHNCSEKTFCANPHTIKYKVLENENDYPTNSEIKRYSNDDINVTIKEINEGIKTGLKQEKINELKSKISLVGEEFIRSKLGSMIRTIKVI